MCEMCEGEVSQAFSCGTAYKNWCDSSNEDEDIVPQLNALLKEHSAVQIGVGEWIFPDKSKMKLVFPAGVEQADSESPVEFYIQIED